MSCGGNAMNQEQFLQFISSPGYKNTLGYIPVELRSLCRLFQHSVTQQTVRRLPSVLSARIVVNAILLHVILPPVGYNFDVLKRRLKIRVHHVNRMWSNMLWNDKGTGPCIYAREYGNAKLIHNEIKKMCFYVFNRRKQ